MSLISRIYYSIDRDNDEFHHRVSTWLDQFSIPLRSIEKYIRLIERNSRSIKTHITEFFQNFPATVFDIFIAFLHQKYLLILSMKIYRSNIKVFNIIIENHNNARNFENIILISLGINFIILALAYCLIIKKKKNIYIYIYNARQATIWWIFYKQFAHGCGFSSIPTSPFLYHWEVDSPNTYHTLSECQVRFWCYWEALEEARLRRIQSGILRDPES